MLITNYKLVPEHGGGVCCVGIHGGKRYQTSTIDKARKGEIMTRTGSVYQLEDPHPSMWEIELQVKRPEKYGNLRKAGFFD